MIDPQPDLEDAVVDRLAPALGHHTARHAIRVARKKASTPPGPLGPAHIAALCEELRPMLRTLAGRARADRIVGDIMGLVG